MRTWSLRAVVFSGFALYLCACASAGDDEPVDTGAGGPASSKDASNQDVLEAVKALPEAELISTTRDGVATALRGDLARVGAMRADDPVSAEALLRPELAHVVAPFRLGADDLRLTRITTDEGGARHARYRQVRDGLDVIGGDLVVHIDRKGTIYRVNGSARGDLPSYDGVREIDAEQAVAAVARDGRFLSMAATADARMVYIIRPDGAMYRAWETVFEGEREGDPQRDRVYVDVDTGSIVAIHPQYHYLKNRQVHSAGNGTSLPGTLLRSEGQAASGDVDVNAAYDNSGIVYDFYLATYGRDSYDRMGGTLTSTVHYSTSYCNALWNGAQVFYGDGNPAQGCGPLARSLDVVAHELTHGVTERESNLHFVGESGGLSEAMSDIAAATITAYSRGWVVDDAVFLIGEEVLPPFLRNMCDPAADGASLDVWSSNAGNEPVQYSSGIGNLAFCLLSRGGTHPQGETNVNVAGIGIQRAASLFYKINTDILTPSSNYAAARSASVQGAIELGFTATEQQSVMDAWAAVGVFAVVPEPDIPLTDGVAITGISGTEGSQRFYTLEVPASQTSLVFTLAGGSGDADLYVRRGERPTITSFQCRPYSSGNSETCTFSNPAAGTWYVMLRGFAAYSNTSIKGDYSAVLPPPGDPYLQDDVPVTGLSGAQGSTRYWRIAVPPGTPQLTVRISGGTGDADLYTRFGSRPTTSTYSCRPYLAHNNETCTINSPAAGDHYIMLRGYSAYLGVTLVGSY